MKFTMFVAIFALSVNAAAQNPPKSTTPSGDQKQITVVGCLRAGAQANQFVLASTADPLAKGVAVAVSGAIPNVTYLLSGGTNLSSHVGHRVEVTGSTSGKVEKAVSTDTTVKKTEAKGPDTRVETKETAAIEMRDLRIESLKMVATTCATPK